MFFRQLAKLIGICIPAIALIAAVARPEAISGQSPPGNKVTNARSGPATGGVVGTVETMSSSSFVLSTVIGQKVIIDVLPTTEWTSLASASVITAGHGVLVVGIVDGRTIVASQVIVQSAEKGGSTSSRESGVVPSQKGAAAAEKRAGHIPPNYRQGAGTIVSGFVAIHATKAALANYPRGVVDRVVKLSDGEYEVHNIGVQWPHHIFVSSGFKVVCAF